MAGDVKGWWVEVRRGVVSLCWRGGNFAGGDDGGGGEGFDGEDGEVGGIGVNSGKCVIQRGANPVGGMIWPFITAALWMANRRLPRGVEPVVNGVSGRACKMRTSPG